MNSVTKRFDLTKTGESDNYAIFSPATNPQMEFENRKGDKVKKDALTPNKIYIAKPLANGSDAWVLIERKAFDAAIEEAAELRAMSKGKGKK